MYLVHKNIFKSISSGFIGCGKGLKLEVQGCSIGKQPSSSKHLDSFPKPKTSTFLSKHKHIHMLKCS